VEITELFALFWQF